MHDSPRFVFEYVLTRRDIRDWQRAIRTTWFDWFRFAIVIVLIGSACWSFIHGKNAEGFATVVLAGLIFRVGKPLASPVYLVFMSLVRLRFRVEFDDHEVRVTSFVRKSHKPSQTVARSWDDLARDGEAREHQSGFVFAYGRIVQFAIPRLAFDSEEQIQAFRAFVHGKMGERCTFANQSLEERI